MQNKQETELIPRPKYFLRLFIAFILASIVFFGVFFIGYNVSYNKYTNLVQSQESLRYSMLSFEVEKQIIADNCSTFDPFLFYEEVNKMGDMIGILEERLGKDNGDVLEQKKVYSLLEARHLLYILEHNNKCSNKYPVILFFYSNLKDDKNAAESLGYILTTVKNNHKDLLLVYSFDYNLDSELIKILKEKYQVNRPNVIVIGNQTLLNVFENSNDVEKAINTIYNR